MYINGLRISYQTGAISIGATIGIIILIIVIVCLVLLWQKRKVSQVVARVSIAL